MTVSNSCDNKRLPLTNSRELHPMRSTTREDKPDDIDALFDAGRLESVQAFYDQTKTVPDRRMLDHRIAALKKNAETQRAGGEIRRANRLVCRAKALEIFKDHGFDPEKLIRPADLPIGYCGKILLVIVCGRRVGERVCLRSGDDWHREILKNTVEEMADLGFEHVAVTPAGGAAARFNDRGEIIIHGGSDEYGACDKHLAAELIAGLFPDTTIRVLT